MVDTRDVKTGKDGQLFLDDGTFLAAIPSFNAQLNVNNIDYQPAGSAQVKKIMSGYYVTLGWEETVVSDTTLFLEVMQKIANGEQVILNLQGKIKGRSGQYQRVVYREWVPDGALDIQAIVPGEIIKRAWSGHVNEPLEIQEYFDV